jgi:lipopolysaccharide transport system permease protein
MTHFVLSIPVFVLFMFIYGKHPSWVWFVGIPVMLVVQYLFSYGIALFVASVNLFFRDLERLVTILVTMLFYFTPIIYPETMIPEGYRHLLSYNPIAPLIISWRQILLNGSLDGQAMSLALLYGVILFGVGTWVYRKLSWKFAEVL